MEEVVRGDNGPCHQQACDGYQEDTREFNGTNGHKESSHE